MQVITVASVKGGVGKTTLSLLLAAELALSGHKVALLDCDLNQHAFAFAQKSKIPNLTVIGEVNETNVVSTIRGLQQDTDLTFIDLPGMSSTLALKAFQMSNLVLIPSRLSLPDLKDAYNTNRQVNDAEELRQSMSGNQNLTLKRSIVWTAIPSGYESVVARNVREAAAAKDVAVLSSGLFDRTAYREIHFTGEVPRQTDPKGKAADNVYALAEEVLKTLATAEETV